LKIEAKDNPIIINEIKNRIKKYKEVRCALVVDTPFDTAISILYENLSQALDKYNYKTFSTIESAKSWLKTGM
jgi:malate/lactate dehydrogenase